MQDQIAVRRLDCRQNLEKEAYACPDPEVVRVAGGPATRELFGWRAGRPRWRAALSEDLAGRLAA